MSYKCILLKLKWNSNQFSTWDFLGYVTYLRFSWVCDLSEIFLGLCLPEIFLGLWPTWDIPGSMTYPRYSGSMTYLRFSWFCDLHVPEIFLGLLDGCLLVLCFRELELEPHVLQFVCGLLKYSCTHKISSILYTVT